LATEYARNLSCPERVLRWIFKVNDFNSSSSIDVETLEDVACQILGLCMTKPEDPVVEKAIVAATMCGFTQTPYPKRYLSEEEFVFDCLNNDVIYDLLAKSIKLAKITGAPPLVPKKQSASTVANDILGQKK